MFADHIRYEQSGEDFDVRSSFRECAKDMRGFNIDIACLLILVEPPLCFLQWRIDRDIARWFSILEEFGARHVDAFPCE
ncbi:hypothetical protein M218_23775 [Burkholderia pseudomallei MSHR338]|nr:hypothetical protein D512_25788 [Burkholderia pseudomallei MSHR1043]EQA86523.1 hypothetical protein M218_23775 [Burkholderia pseudomallei MSHR338]KEO66707.1 hypothetical protein J103_26500 [Burkholderia pseudomallei MSHR5855]KGC58486.1 hypothetical protein DP56_5449 [Burkholderia pseudomallei]KGS27675.1 hypothetical protein X989_1904 [Burkholderia pseudomallei MSHR4378]KGS87272.1 hypothetical protein X976_4435 [Burkholderia pseudomallei MSHR7500]KGW43498.1 hypothetical protein Y597_4904 [B